MDTITRLLIAAEDAFEIAAIQPLLGTFEAVGTIRHYGRAGRWWGAFMTGGSSWHETFDTLAEAKDWMAEQYYSMGQAADYQPTCNICDGYGHGYPGAGPCPLEIGPPMDPREEMMEALDPQVNGSMTGYWPA